MFWKACTVAGSLLHRLESQSEHCGVIELPNSSLLSKLEGRIGNV